MPSTCTLHKRTSTRVNRFKSIKNTHWKEAKAEILNI